MCSHYWMIDLHNFGVCKLCHETRDFQPGINQFFGSSKLPRKDVSLLRDLMPSLDYPLQGVARYPYQYHKRDYCFSVDDIE